MEIGESLLTKDAKCSIKYFPDVPSKRKFPPKMYPSQTIVRLNDPISGVVKFSLISALFIDKLHYNLLLHKKAIHAIADTHPTITCVGVHGTVNISIETSSPIFCCI